MSQPVNIRRYLALTQDRGFAAESVLAGTGIRVECLHDASYLVDLEQCRAADA
jgi:hypothetical protein